MSTTVIKPNNPQYNTTGQWSAYAGAWGASSLTYGVDYTQSITLNNTTFPNGTLFSWSFPLYGGPFGVWSYPCIVYGSTPELINPTVASTQVANLANLSVSYSTALTVNSGQLDTIFDIWLTSKPYGSMSTATYELEIIPQTDWHYSGFAYTLTDSTLQNANVYVNPNWGGNAWTNIVVAPSSEMLTGTISISDILKSLIWNGVITGQEYISGIEFGPEPGSGSGSLLINDLSYQWNGTPPIQLSAGNDTFQITTPGGNDIVGNGGVDTVIYSGLYSQFQIKTSGSETLVTENNNISTLDYLQGITFIQFSDGRYNTVTSTFTPTTVIQVDGSTSFTEIGNNYFLFDSSGSGPELKYAGAAVTAGEFGGWVPIGAVQTVSGYDVAWDILGANQYSVWTTDSNGNFLTTTAALSGTSYTLESYETTFNQDLNGDGTIGLTTKVIQTDGSTSLTEVANEFFLYAAGSGPALKYDGAAVVAGEFGPWTPIGALQTASGYDVAWDIPGANQYSVWTTDSNGNFLTTTAALSGTSYTLESYEPIFGQDLNGDGVIGLYAAPVTTLQISQPLSGPAGAATIGAHGTLEIGEADSATVTFAASTGMLKLDQPSTFSAPIFGFTGDGTLAGSDQIDLSGLNFSTVQDSYANGVLTVIDGTHSAKLYFNGSYVPANFKLADDGSGGTIVYDPPVPGPSQGAAGTQVSTDTHNDVFVFHPNLGQSIGSQQHGVAEAFHDRADLALAALTTVHDAHEELAFSGQIAHDAIVIHDGAAAQAPHHAHFLI